MRVCSLAIASLHLISSTAVASYSSDGAPVEDLRPKAAADLVAPADLLSLSFVLRIRNPDPDRMLYSARVVTEDLLKKARAAAEGATLKLRNVQMQTEGEKYLKTDSPGLDFVVDGEIQVALPAGDFFARSKFVASLEKLARQTESATRDGKSGVVAGFGAVEARVRDPESHRSALLKTWSARARELADAVGGHGLHFSGCEVPGSVTQRAISQQEVELTLTIACRMSFGPGPK